MNRSLSADKFSGWRRYEGSSRCADYANKVIEDLELHNGRRDVAIAGLDLLLDSEDDTIVKDALAVSRVVHSTMFECIADSNEAKTEFSAPISEKDAGGASDKLLHYLHRSAVREAEPDLFILPNRIVDSLGTIEPGLYKHLKEEKEHGLRIAQGVRAFLEDKGPGLLRDNLSKLAEELPEGDGGKAIRFFREIVYPPIRKYAGNAVALFVAWNDIFSKQAGIATAVTALTAKAVTEVVLTVAEKSATVWKNRLLTKSLVGASVARLTYGETSVD